MLTSVSLLIVSTESGAGTRESGSWRAGWESSKQIQFPTRHRGPLISDSTSNRDAQGVPPDPTIQLKY